MRHLPTAPIAAAGLIVGFGVADATGNRALGGVVLAVGGLTRLGVESKVRAVDRRALLATYVAAFAVRIRWQRRSVRAVRSRCFRRDRRSRLRGK